MLVTHNVFFPMKDKFSVLNTFDMSSANVLNLENGEAFLSGKGG